MTPAQLQAAALSWLGFTPEQQTDTNDPDVAAAGLVSPAVCSWVGSLPSIDLVPLDPPDPEEPDASMWAPNTVLGAVMLAARLVRRRNSPHGIESFVAGQGAAYVRRTDPDVAQLLHLGAYAKPKIG